MGFGSLEKGTRLMRIPIKLFLFGVFCFLSGIDVSAHEIEHKFEKFSDGEYCQELNSEGKKVTLCIASVRLSNESTIGYGSSFYCAGKLRITMEGRVKIVSVKKVRGNKNLMRHCLKSMKRFTFYPPLTESGERVELRKIIMSMNYVEKKYPMALITPYDVYINFGDLKNFTKKPLSGIAVMTFLVVSPQRRN